MMADTLPNWISDRRFNEKATSNATEACVLHASEEKQRPRFAWRSRHGLRIHSDGTNGALSQGSPRESVGFAPASTIFS
jgi:hypothetical protein